MRDAARLAGQAVLIGVMMVLLPLVVIAALALDRGFGDYFRSSSMREWLKRGRR